MCSCVVEKRGLTDDAPANHRRWDDRIRRHVERGWRRMRALIGALARSRRKMRGALHVMPLLTCSIHRSMKIASSLSETDLLQLNEIHRTT